MKINLNKKDEQYLEQLLETKENNMIVADMLNDLCFSSIESSKSSFNKVLELNEKEQLLNVAFYNLNLDLDDEDNQEIINKYIKNTFSFSNIDPYANNEFNKLFQNIDVQQDGYHLYISSIEPYSFFPLDEIKVYEEENFREESYISVFKEKFSFLTLTKDDQIWMAVNPNEINTMKPYVSKAKGKVLTFGLGLGYFSFMCSLKNDVDSIIIVEKDKTIIELFKQYILPKFEHKEKIVIIEKDAFDYLDENNIDTFDFTFVDIWHNAEDGLSLFIKFIKKIGISNKVSYWLEESIICMLRRCLLILIEEQMFDDGNLDYSKSKNEFDRIINDLYIKTKDVTFTNFNEIKEFLKKESLLKLI